MKSNKNQQFKLYYVIIVVLCFGLYSNTLNHDYVLDDFSVIKENFVVKQGVKGIPLIWKTHYRYGYGYQSSKLYRPLTLSVFALQWQIAQDQPSIAHLFNVLIYLFLCLLIFKFFQLSLGDEYTLVAFISTILFMAHPIHTEVVANIKSLDELLASTLYFSSLLLLFRYLRTNDFIHLLISIVLVSFAFFAKESTVTLLLCTPVILTLLKKVPFKKSLKLSSIYLIPLGLYLVIRNQVLGTLTASKTTTFIDNILVKAPDELTKLASAIKFLGLYLWKLILPHPLMNDYSYKQLELTGFNDIYVWLSFFTYLILLYLFIRYRRKKPIIAFAIIFYLINLSLYSNLFFTIGTAFGERLLFMPSLGFALAAGYFITLSEKNNLDLKKLRFSKPLAITGLILALYSFKTVNRNKAWKDNFTLYSTDINNCNKSARCHYYLGLGYMREKAINEKVENKRRNLLRKALNSFNEAIRIYPEYSDAWGQKGLAHFRLGESKESENAYLESIRLYPLNAITCSNLGSLYFSVKQYQAAKLYFQKALKVNPNHLNSIANYAATLGTIGEYEEAIRYFQKAIELNPNEASYYQMLGTTYQNMGNIEQASYYLNMAARIKVGK